MPNANASSTQHPVVLPKRRQTQLQPIDTRTIVNDVWEADRKKESREMNVRELEFGERDVRRRKPGASSRACGPDGGRSTVLARLAASGMAPFVQSRGCLPIIKSASLYYFSIGLMLWITGVGGPLDFPYDIQSLASA